MRRIGVITSGGDAPGTNACVRVLVRRCLAAGIDPVGIFDSWDGLLAGTVRVLEREDVVGIVQTAGTILRSARSRLFLEPGDAERALEALAAHGVEGLIVVGGNGSLTAASILAESGFPVVGVPKTIDNDVPGTDTTVGFRTAVQVATDALDNLRATAESHSRVMVLEVMGRNAGWIGVESAIAGGADLALVPERAFRMEDVYDRLRKRHEVHGRNYSIVVVAEGARDEGGILSPVASAKDRLGRPRLEGVGMVLAREIESRLGYPSRCTVLGYLQRSTAPVAADRILATRLSDAAFELLLAGESGVMAGLEGGQVSPVDLHGIAGGNRRISDADLRLADVFG
ncbi:MAG: ATP-dependent 6-phosphofructokinase [Acidobacteriota bacterium]|nr:ATP-dependent 6-phosphofructokinase [Acidobacteriota bacterium]